MEMDSSLSSLINKPLDPKPLSFPVDSLLPPHPSPSFSPSSMPMQPTLSPPAFKRRRFGAPPIAKDLGEYIAHDVDLIEKMGWDNFVCLHRSRNDFGSLQYPHPANHYLRSLQKHGCPVRLHSKPWSRAKLLRSLCRGCHRSCLDYIDYLQEEFIDMIQKSQWVLLPFDIASKLPNLTLSPPGVIPQRERRPRWICDYSFSGINEDTVHLAPLEAMQYGNALHRFL
jgi:hypothetical protein